MDFTNIDFDDENACFRALLDWVHPEGLRCPRCLARNDLRVCRRHKTSWIPDYRCSRCRHKSNAWTGTPLQGIRHPPSHLWQIMLANSERKPTTQLALDLDCQRGPLSRLRARLRRMVNDFGPPAIQS
jgi:transposase-like protein